MNHNIQLALVDDDKLVVQLLSDYFQKQEGLEVCMTAYSGNTFVAQLESQSAIPNVVLLDLRMSDGDGIETIEAITPIYPQLKIIVLSSYYKSSFMSYMLKSGVHAFVPKETDKETLVQIIRDVHDKGHYFMSEQIKALRQQLPTKKPPFIGGENSKDLLSNRETEVLKLICQQYTAKEIAQKIFVSPKTVEAHKGNLLLKTGVKNMAGLIIYAVQNAIVNPNEVLLLD